MTVHVQIPEPKDVDLQRNHAFADVMKLRIQRLDHPGFRVGSESNDRCPHKKKTEEDLRYRSEMCGGRGRDRSDIFLSQGLTMATGSCNRAMKPGDT